MTAEPIAAVVADIRAGRVRHTVPDDALNHLLSDADAVVNTHLLHRAQQPQPVVDATAIYHGLRDKASFNLYDDFPQIMSPWNDAIIAYVNVHGNVVALQVHAEPWGDRRPWGTDNSVDWERVRWRTETSVWMGGRTAGRPLRTTGPAHLLRAAVYDDGSAADLHWVALLRSGGNEGTWEMPQAVLCAALNFLSCVNVEVAEPVRPFPVRRRLRQSRVSVQTIVVRPPGRHRPGSGVGVRPIDECEAPLVAVRGSFGHYGPRYGRGLLFGRYEGKFWRPAHARGGGEGDPVRHYVLRPGRAAAR